MNRGEQISRLQGEEFDLCVIGGGASGAGCALDAALRGLRVALVEKGDFASGTSSKSTKLAHGGVRYLEMAFKKLDFGQLNQVRHGLRERRNVLANAPHLARPLAIVTPVFSWWEGLYYAFGLRLYDWFAGKSRLAPSRWLGRREALAMVSGLSPKIRGAVLYYDGQMDDARYALALVQTAAKQGAVAANYVAAKGFRSDGRGRLAALLAADVLAGPDAPPLEIRAKVFLNCTGPFADSVRQMANPSLPARIRPSKGAHVVLPGDVLPGNSALLIPKTKDGRMVFAIPFEGQTLVGTTDEPLQNLGDEPLLLSAEAGFLLETVRPFLAAELGKGQIRAGFGGIRPLVKPLGKDGLPNTGAMLRDHEVEVDPVSGLLSLLGGKWTTYRLMASDAVDEVCRTLGLDRRCETEHFPLAGSDGFEEGDWRKLSQYFGLDGDICLHLYRKYGSAAPQVAALAQENAMLRERILPKYPFLCAEIVYAVQREMAVTVRDFLARRVRLEMTDWDAALRALPTVAHWMGRELGWPQAQKDAQIEAYRSLIAYFKAQATA